MRSSTARLLPTLDLRSDASDLQEVKVIPAPENDDLEIELTPVLESKLNLLNHRMVLLGKSRLIIKKGFVSLKSMNAEFKALMEISHDESITKQERVAIEEYKSVMMQSFKNDLQKRYSDKEEKKPEPPKKRSKWRLALFGALILLELIPMTVGGFLGVSTLMTSIPGVSDLLVYGASVAVCAIEGLMFYSVMGPLFKKALGIEVNESAGSLLQAYEDKLHLAEDINKRMVNEVDCTDKIKCSRYQEYAALTKHFNDDVSQTKVAKFKEPPYKKVVRWGLSALNLMLNIGGGYFMATALLSMVAASLAGTPIGWGIIGLVVLGGLVGRFAIRSDSMFDMLNPKAKKYEEVQKKVDDFESQNDKINSIVVKKKKQVELLSENTKLKTENVKAEHHNRNLTCLPGVAKKMPGAMVNDIKSEVSHRVVGRRSSIA